LTGVGLSSEWLEPLETGSGQGDLYVLDLFRLFLSSFPCVGSSISAIISHILSSVNDVAGILCPAIFVSDLQVFFKV
jgi:hypothetical protein